MASTGWRMSWSVIGLALLLTRPLPAQDAADAAAMLGCYHLSLDVGTAGGALAPSVFRLDNGRPVGRLPVLRRIDAARRRTDSSSSGSRPRGSLLDTTNAFGQWRHALPDPWVPGSRNLWNTAWRIVSADTLEVAWSDGYSSIRLDLPTGSDTLRGELHSGSDQGLDDTEAAKAWRTTCPA